MERVENFLSQKEKEILKKYHKEVGSRKLADRIKTILMLNDGYSYSQISEILLIDDTTGRKYFKVYVEKGVDELLVMRYEGRDSKLSGIQLYILSKHIEENIIKDAKEIQSYIKEQFNVEYSEKYIPKLVSTLGYSYKKTTLVPSKADEKRQLEHVEMYEMIKEAKDEEDVMLFADGAHPTHNSNPIRCYIKKGESKAIPSNSGRERVNIHGAINIEDMDITYQLPTTINQETTIEFLEQIREKYQTKNNVFLFTDNARYYRAKKVQSYLEKTNITMIFLPPYSPNLNPIERLWKFMKQNIIGGNYFEKFADFKNSIVEFLENPKPYLTRLKSLITDNFQIIANPLISKNYA
ncbi:MAG TPA: IS630 family transposase [Campylobacterales bacterium]|nr:IS630 family transposase [Campylobacterales bacterium]